MTTAFAYYGLICLVWQLGKGGRAIYRAAREVRDDRRRYTEMCGSWEI
jgi:hypothetical protein